MAAHDQRSDDSPVYFRVYSRVFECSLERMLTALYIVASLGVAGVGVLGLIGPSLPKRMLESSINMHVLFGLLLCGLILARYQWVTKRSPRMVAIEIRELSRHLSRIVYLTIYAVIGVTQMIAIVGSIWQGGAPDFNLLDERFRNGDHRTGFNADDGFEMLLASGIFVLVIVRVLAFRLWLHSVERAEQPQLVSRVDVSRASK